MLEAKRQPYEFLVRWDTSTGKIKGSHVQFANVISEDGVFASEQLAQPMPVGTEYPLRDILDLIHIEALKTTSETAKELDEIKANLAERDTEIVQLKDRHFGELLAKNKELANKSAELEKIQQAMNRK